MRTIIPFIVCLLVLLASCAGSAPSPAPTPTPNLGPAPTGIPITPVTPVPVGGAPTLPPGVNGRIVFAPGDGSIWLQEGLGAKPQPFVKASASAFAEAPAFSPDGNRIAFRQMLISKTEPASISIQVMNVDGSGQHAVAAPPDSKSDVLWPAFSADGQWVYYTLESSDHRRSEIHRAASDGGNDSKVIDDGRQVTLSPDGKRMAFARFNTQTFSSSLWIADAGGKNAKQIVRDDAFLTIAAPKFSPDSQSILFAASGPPRHDLRAECQPVILCLLSSPAYADGLPWNLWLVQVEKGSARQLTAIGADSPWPAWSHDGRYIAFFDTSGLYLLDTAVGAVTELSRNGGHGIMDWWSQ